MEEMQVVNAIMEKFSENEQTIENEESAEIFDLADPVNQEFYVQKALDLINTAYKKYKVDVNIVKDDTKYSHQYKQDKCKELKEQFLLFKELQLTRAEEELGKIRTHLQDLDSIDKIKEDKLLTEVSRMNLLNMMTMSLKFEDDTFIKSIVPEVVKHADLKLLLEQSIKGTKKGHLVVNIEKEYQTQNAKYISLDKLQDKIKTIRSYKDTIFKNLDMTKLEAIK